MAELLYCRDENPEHGGVPLLLIHGFLGASENLMGIARAFDHRPVSLVDLRNHGRSFHANSMTLQQMAEDIVQLAEHKGWQRIDVLGHSLGGKVALQLSQLVPDLIDQLIIADIAPVVYKPHHEMVLKGLDAVDMATVRRRADADKAMSEYIHEPGVRGFLLMNLVRNPEGGFQWRCNLEGLKANYDSVLSVPAFRQAFQGRTLYIRGGDSDYVLPEHEAEMSRYTPNYTIGTLEGCGHWLHAEQPKVFNRKVADFLA